MPMTTFRDLLTSYTAAAICPGSSDSLRLPSMIVCSGLAIMITPFRACWCEEWCEIFMPYRNYKGLVAGCHSFLLFFIFYNIHTFIQSHSYNTFIHRHSLRPLSISSLLVCSVEYTSLWCRAEVRTRACLTASRRAIPTEPRRTITEPRRTITEPRRTITEPRRTITEPRRTIY
jgi:hypothetical protein